MPMCAILLYTEFMSCYLTYLFFGPKNISHRKTISDGFTHKITFIYTPTSWSLRIKMVFSCKFSNWSFVLFRTIIITIREQTTGKQMGKETIAI